MDHSQHNSYRLSFELANRVWLVVRRWDNFAQNTLGKQITSSADSVSANIVEGWNRYHKKDKVLFLLYARASLHETAEWLRKAHSRNLISEDEYGSIRQIMLQIPKEINGLIKGIKQNLKE